MQLRSTREAGSPDPVAMTIPGLSMSFTCLSNCTSCKDLPEGEREGEGEREREREGEGERESGREGEKERGKEGERERGGERERRRGGEERGREGKRGVG